MKTIKYLLWLIILGSLGILIYQNLDYFMAPVALKFDLKVSSWNWTIPELQNIAYFGICFLLGILLVGLKAVAARFRFKKEIKTKDAALASLREKVNTLKTELDVFQHDPYIKNELIRKPSVELPASGPSEETNEKDQASESTD